MKSVKTRVPLALLLVTLSLPVRVSTGQVTIAWNLASPEENVAGYRVYSFVEQFALPPIDVGFTNVYSFADLTSDLRSLIFVTAYDSTGQESDASSVVEYPQESACLFANAPAQAIISSFRTADEFFVTTRADPVCPVEITSDAPWIKVTKVTEQQGRIRVSYTVDRNQDSSARSGSILTGLGEPFPILQTGGFPTVPSFVGVPPTAISVDEGGSLVLSAQVEDNEPVQVQWLKDGQPLPGATALTYTRSAISSTDQGNYWVAVSNENGTALGPSTGVTLYQKPRFPPGTEPKTTFAVVGKEAFLSGSPSGTELQYGWLKNGVLLTNTQSLIAFSPVTDGDFASYQLTASNRLGIVTSAPAYLTSRSFEQKLGRTHVFLLDDGNLLVQAEGVPGENCDVQVSRDLLEWSTFGSLIIPEVGFFTIESPKPATDPYGQWFVRTIRYPSSQ